MIFSILPTNRTQDADGVRDDEEVIFESSLESFPASDPPAWVFGRDRATPAEPVVISRPACDVKRIPEHILERALAKLRDIRKGYYGGHS